MYAASGAVRTSGPCGAHGNCTMQEFKSSTDAHMWAFNCTCTDGYSGELCDAPPADDSGCSAHSLHSIRWLPFRGLRVCPWMWEHVVFYSVLLLGVLLVYCAPNRGTAQGGSEEAPQSRARRIDTTSLTGLRGFAALHVAMGHHVSKVPELGFIYGGTAMPFFYLLSGFIMVIAYAAKPVARPSMWVLCSRRYEPTTSTGELDTPETPPVAVFDARRFWRNRFARLFPVYFATNLLTLPLIYDPPSLLPKVGQDSVRSLVLGSVGLTSWSELSFIGRLLPGPNGFVFPPNCVCWTISTMMFFYVGENADAFPYV